MNIIENFFKRYFECLKPIRFWFIIKNNIFQQTTTKVSFKFHQKMTHKKSSIGKSAVTPFSSFLASELNNVCIFIKSGNFFQLLCSSFIPSKKITRDFFSAKNSGILINFYCCFLLRFAIFDQKNEKSYLRWRNIFGNVTLLWGFHLDWKWHKMR